MNFLSKPIIYSTLIMGTLITLFSSHWLLMWIGLEMSMLAMIPIMMPNFTPRSTEAATKYFLTQASASMLLLFSIMLTMTYSGQWAIMQHQNQMASFMLTISLMMKLGLAPFHFWVPEVLQGIPLLPGLILLTWQKMAPLAILFQSFSTINKPLMLTSAILSVLLGGWGGLNQTQLRKIMAYSSIAHMGWMAAILIYNPSIMMMNYIIYTFLTTSMFSMFIMYNNTTTSSLSHTWNISPLLTAMMMITLLSLGGLPPLTGFAPKWLIIQEMMKNNNIILPTAMAMVTLLNLYFYMRLVYSTSLTLFPSKNNTKIKWLYQHTKHIPLLPVTLVLSAFLLPLTPMTNILF
uniref:NADH-ubiquinone oxidoreductase chain 2 n=1 Tax=Cavia porcellus TaxID=10141 RepID=Q9TEH0_CAVPO|nr:NADH dehydrogenase subunit 2 [Cavia porcellus]AJE26518.1 NADH dehydrogenase subunit 2 [Cavia porcellus]QIQ22933.1 NADH dehydrogenase subunit 2 [Cavia porcellus]CAB51819.1 NADH dehydrogenase subunit 2 [Cavia porcellus]